MSRRIALLIGCVAVVGGSARLAEAQVSFDPPTSINPPPNVMVLMDATRTTLINIVGCFGVCHAGTGSPFVESPDIFRLGTTRLQVARRALTGGYGWNTNVVGAAGPADARIRREGVMDRYPVRWGVSWYDGLGTRLAIDPTSDSLAAQKAVIDFGQTPNDTIGYVAGPDLNSFISFTRTTQCCGGYLSTAPYDPVAYPFATPWFDEASVAEVRMGRALSWVRDYWDPAVDAAQFTPGPIAAAYPQWFAPGPDPQDEAVIDADPSNVLNAAGAAGCRRNYTILMSDSHGLGDFAGQTTGDWARQVYDLAGPGGALAASERNKVFYIHFGPEAAETRVADTGWDGVADNAPGPYEAAVGGDLDFNRMTASFEAILSSVLAGQYSGAPPTITRAGDFYARTSFRVLGCDTNPESCNFGRPADLVYGPVPAPGDPMTVSWNAADILRARPHWDRHLYTGMFAGDPNAPTETNCGPAATCATPTAAVAPINAGALGGLFGPDPDDVNADVIAFLRGDPASTYAHGVLRGDEDGDGAIDNPYKLADIVNSRPVVVGAPPGIGKDLARWTAFRDSVIERSAASAGGDDTFVPVSRRDQVLYVGGNDGFLHSFLVARANPTPDPGTGATYAPFATACDAVPAGSGEVGPSAAACNGKELWGYSPRLLQDRWALLRSGHQFMVDGTPVVEDVLFTKNTANPGPLCSYSAYGPQPECTAASWEYRTVLVQCLSGGGPGCFALDVTNPWRPGLLWERELSSVVGKVSSSSQPTIVTLRRLVGAIVVPYAVAVMGGGNKEADALGNPKGTFIAVGIEDGVVFTSPTTADADFASSPTCADGDGDGFTDTCYILTTRGAVYKVRFAGGDPASMTMVKFFEGQDATASGNADIRTFTKLVATPTTDNRVAMFFATGDVEDATSAGEQNYLFKIRDLDPADMTPWDGDVGGTFANIARQAGACPGGVDPLLDLGTVNPGDVLPRRG